MSLLERIREASEKPPHRPPCIDCKHLIEAVPNVPFCVVKDKIILPDFPPTKCELREE